MSCRYSPIGPIKILQELQDAGHLKNYLLLLAHDVIEHEADYVFLLDDICGAADPHIILDNGVIELGKAMSFEQVLEAADIIIPACVIMPDVIGDFQATQRAVEAEMPHIENCEYPVMKVPQGSDLSEVVRCVEWLVEAVPLHTREKDYWGVPRWITNKLGSRAPIIEYINRICPEPAIHLLGMSDNWTDDMVSAHMPNVIGIDSANPVVLGLMEHRMETDKYRHLPRGDYWKMSEITGKVLENIVYVREALT